MVCWSQFWVNRASTSRRSGFCYHRYLVWVIVFQYLYGEPNNFYYNFVSTNYVYITLSLAYMAMIRLLMETVLNIVAHCKLQSTDHYVRVQSRLLQFLSLDKIWILRGRFYLTSRWSCLACVSVLVSFFVLIMHRVKSSMIFHDLVLFSEYFNLLLIMLITDSINWVVFWNSWLI